VSTVFGYGARGTAICLERPPQGERTASAGYYNLAAAQRRARRAARRSSSSTATRSRTR
jgi:trans-2-enoyl-CoA reductase